MSGNSFNFLRKFTRIKARPKTDQKLIKQLSKQPLFKNTPGKVLAEIASRVKVHHLTKDDFVLRAGEASTSLFILRTGWVKIVGKDNSGEPVVLNHLGPGQVIGEMSMIDKKPRSSSVIVLRSAEVMEIDYDVILNILDQYPILGKSLLQEMFNRVRFANAYVEETVEWCRQIAAGNYDFVQDQVQETQSTVVDMTKSDEARASAFLSVFFKMVEVVKERELTLKKEVQRLAIQIDEVKRQESVKELTDSDFFEELQDAAQKIRAERAAKSKEESEQGDGES